MKKIKKSKDKITIDDYVKAVKKADREREIAAHGKLISTMPTRVHQSKMVYKRNKKVDIDNLTD